MSKRSEKDPYTEIIDFMIRRRLEAGISQREMSMRIGLDDSTWGHIENGRRHLRAIEMFKALKVLGLKVVLVECKK